MQKIINALKMVLLSIIESRASNTNEVYKEYRVNQERPIYYFM